MTPKPRFNISKRLLLATLLPMLVIFIIVIVIINQILYKANANLARERTANIASQLAAKAEAVFTPISRTLELTTGEIAGKLTLDALSPDAPEHYIRDLLAANPEAYCTWIIFNSEYPGGGKSAGLAYVREGGVISPLRHFDEVRTPVDDDSVWLDLPTRTKQATFIPFETRDFGPGLGEKSFGGYAAPVMHEGKAIAVIGIIILYETTFPFLDKLAQEQGQNYLLLADDGQILFTTDTSIQGHNIASLPYPAADKAYLLAQLKNGGDGMFDGRSPHLGKSPTLYALSRFTMPHSDRRLSVLSEVSTYKLYGEARRANELIMSTALIGLLLLGACVYVATREIVNSIKRLNEKAQRIASGDRSLTFEDDRADAKPRHEVDMLENSIMSMVEQLGHAHDLGIMAMEAEFEREKIAQASEAKDRFFANMSHEIRTPMNAILGMAELLLSKPLKTDERKCAKDIKIATESLLGIINDILDLSRLESGKLPLVPVHYDLREFLGNIKSLCELLTAHKNLAFVLDAPANLPSHLYGDNLRLRQVLLNLIGNAVKFTREGAVTLRVRESGNFLNFYVVDTGIGIKPDEVDKLFKPFEQLDAAKNRGIGGTGLGLSISRNLVELMGGSISVASEYGKGSTFSISVPFAPGNPGQVAQPEKISEKTSLYAGARALIVDDSVINLDVAVGLIGLYGVKCDRAENGRQALEMVQRTCYDIVFMDHMMPEMDGVEATKRIRALGGSLAKLPIVALTANAFSGTKDMFLAAGMNDYLSKPIVREQLQAVLFRWLASKRLSESARIAAKRTTSIRRDAAKSGKTSGMTMETLGAVPGLNVNLGLKNAGGNIELYYDVLRRLVGMRDKFGVQLTTTLATDNLQAFAIEVHGAKGAMANVGAVRLAAKAAAMESAAKGGNAEKCRQALPPYLAELEEFFASLGEIVK